MPLQQPMEWSWQLPERKAFKFTPTDNKRKREKESNYKFKVVEVEIERQESYFVCVE